MKKVISQMGALLFSYWGKGGNLLLLTLLVASGSSAAFDIKAPPRMWKATSPAIPGEKITTFYILGITHIGFSEEYDEYFYNKVMPVFLASDTLSYEGAGGREDEPKPECDKSTLGEDGAALLERLRARYVSELKRILLAEKTRQEKLGIYTGPPAVELVQELENSVANKEEYSLLLYLQRTQQLAAEHTVGPSLPDVHGSVIGALIQARNGNKFLSRDVDSKYASLRAYCQSGRARLQLLENQLTVMNTAAPSLDQLADIQNLRSEFVNVLSEMRFSSSGTSMKLAALDKQFVCGRNSEWMDDIKALTDGRQHFYALGVKHLLSVDHSFAHCGGLLTDLSKAGFALERIE